MSETRLFGTDGVRGTANVHPMTAEMALSLGQAIARIFRAEGSKNRRIIIGKDTRLSGYLFEDALAAGICSMGVDVIQVGPMPTPAMAFLTADMRCQAGVMISASHNPYHDNGIKFFSSDGYKLPDVIERRVLVVSFSDSGFVQETRNYALEDGRVIDPVTRETPTEGKEITFLQQMFGNFGRFSEDTLGQ